MNSWRGTYVYQRSDLISYLREMRTNQFSSGYMLRREIYLQAHERGLIRLPDNFSPNEAHRIPFSEVTVIEPQINQENNDEKNQRGG